MNTGSAATTYTDNKVSAHKRYAYRVKAINSEGPGGQSNYVNVETPAAPTGLTVSSVSHDSVTLTWDDPGDTSITGYQVLRRPRDGEEYEDGKGSTTFVAIENDTGSSATSYTDASVTPRTRYVYRVKAKNVAGLGPRSSYANTETNQAPTPQPTPVPTAPARPTGLTAEAVAHNSVTLTWDDPGDTSITGYQVLRRPRDGEEYEDGKGSTTFVAIENDTGSSATSYTDISVTPHTRYVYRVKAKNGGGLGPRSSYVNVETSVAPSGAQSVPAKPAGLVASSALDNSVTFGWDDPGDSSITHYKALRREGDSGSFTTIEENTGSSDAAYTDTTVSAETAYEYRVIAVNGSGESPESDSLSVETLPAPSFGFVLVPEPEPEEDPIAAQQIQETDIPAGYGTVFTATMTVGERTVSGDAHAGFSTQGNGAISSTTFSIAGVNYDLERFEQVFSGIVANAGFWLDVGGRLPDDALLLVDNERVRVGVGAYTAGVHKFSDQTFPDWMNGQTLEIRILGPVYDETTNDFSAGIASRATSGSACPERRRSTDNSTKTGSASPWRPARSIASTCWGRIRATANCATRI